MKNITIAYKRVVACILALFMVVMCLPLATDNALAKDAVKTQDEAVSWLKTQEGATYDFNGANGTQCVEFVKAYVNWLLCGDPRTDCWNRATLNGNNIWQNSLWAELGWEVYYNDASFVPQPGDIFSAGISSGNHTGVVISSTVSSAYIADANARDSDWSNGESVWLHNITWKSATSDTAYGATHYIRPSFKTSHDHIYISSITKNASCVDGGITTYTCSCGDSYTEPIPAKGHSWDSGKVITSAGCTAEGVKEFTCSVCNDTYTEALQASGHKEVKDAAVAATCTSMGLTEGSHCSTCGAVIVAQKNILALGHDWEATLVKEPTCTASGIVHFACDRCSEEYTSGVVTNGWTDWSKTKFNGVSSDKEKTKTQYRYSTKETTESSEASLPGWILYETKSEWGEFGEWSAWSSNAIASNDLRQVETKTVTDQAAYTSYSYHHYVSDTYRMSSYTKADSTYSNIQYYTAGKLTAVPRLDSGGHKCYTSSSTGSTNYAYLYWDEVVTNHPAVTHTEYRYRERTPVNTYYYYRWSDYSSWQDTNVEVGENTQLETRTVYSYNLGSLGHNYVGGECTRCSEKDPNASIDENAPVVTVESKTAKAGGKVLLTVNLQNNPGIWGMDLAVNYDKSQLTLVGVTNGTIFSSAEWTQGNLSGDKYILSYEASGFDDITTNGVLATLEFTVNENASVDSFTSVTLSYKTGDVINVNFDDISVVIVSGGVEITNFIYGDLNGDLLVNKKDSLLMKMYLADHSTSIDTQAADVFPDGSINKKDSLYLKQFLAGLDVELGS